MWGVCLRFEEGTLQSWEGEEIGSGRGGWVRGPRAERNRTVSKGCVWLGWRKG